MGLKILFVSAEVSPFFKTGGLADVAGSLPLALKKMGHDVRVVMPEYKLIPEEYRRELKHICHFRTILSWRNEYIGVNTINHRGLDYYFIDNKSFFYQDNIYESDARHVQYALFCKAVLDMLPYIDFKPHIIHCNDWHTGPLCLYLKELYNNDFYRDIRTVFTIHNLKYQGQFGTEIIEDVLGLNFYEHYNRGDIIHNGLVNYMKMGIIFSDMVTSVSKSYVEEIRTPYFGEGLDYAIRMRGENVYGILNGLDYEEYNPGNDCDIYHNYDSSNTEGKLINKKRLQEELNLKLDAEQPLVGLISRFYEQKGLDLIMAVMDEIMTLNIQFVVLGTGEAKYENFFREYGLRYPDRISANIRYDHSLAKKIYAGSDLFLVPSRFEPCGLTQLISLRYGSIPIVRETGGLRDTIQPYNEYTGEGNGFSFRNYNAHDMLYTIRRAVDIYRNKDIWRTLVIRGMESDFSWDKSAGEYIALYSGLVN
ncbi:MAG: glycogen synthase GlgA [Halanaerobiaceae bacterium]|nr:glycogen synthase GlgA [Halanaerobiaceae bacterium]